MSIDRQTVSAFSDEITKIAVVKTVGKWLRRGWDDVADYGGEQAKRRLGGLLPPKPVRGNGWLGKQDTWRRNLPIGPKSIFTGATLAMVPGAVAGKDPLGQERSRAERITDLGADVAGGLIGAGALLSSTGPKWRVGKSILGGLGGSILASRIATTPWRRARERAAQPVLSEQDRAALQRRMG